MSTSKREFKALTNRFPAENPAIRRLQDLVSVGDRGQQPGPRFYSFNRLVDLTKPNSTWDFANIVAGLVESGVLEQVIRLYSPKGTGLKDFAQITDVPDTYFDITSDQEFDVSLDSVEVLYKVPAE